MGFWCSPTGEIHNSVLVGFGEISTFSGALFGVDYSYKYKYGKDEKQEEYRVSGWFIERLSGFTQLWGTEENGVGAEVDGKRLFVGRTDRQHTDGTAVEVGW